MGWQKKRTIEQAPIHVGFALKVSNVWLGAAMLLECPLLSNTRPPVAVDPSFKSPHAEASDPNIEAMNPKP